MPNTVDADQAIAFLNEVLRLDPQGVAALFKCRVRCNAELAAHPTVQANAGPAKEDARFGQSTLAAGEYDFAVLGLLNGLFGADAEQVGFIAAEYEDDGSISRFCRTP